MLVVDVDWLDVPGKFASSEDAGASDDFGITFRREDGDAIPFELFELFVVVGWADPLPWLWRIPA